MLNFQNPSIRMPGHHSHQMSGMHQSMMMGGMAMMMMQMMEMMMSLMSLLMGGQYPMSPGSQFGGQNFGGFPGGSPVGSFLGGSGSPARAPQVQGGAPVATAGAAGPVSSKTQNFINQAKSHQGAPYVFGAAGPTKFDCSGLVHHSLNQAGVKGPRLAARGYQAKYGNNIGRDQLKPGDLVFFHSKNTRGIPKGKATHIEIYLGNGMTMGTDNPKEGARIEKINWNTFIGGGRVPQLQG